jgi:uncharacterized protein involved in outer membrane biogenesis
MRKTLKVIGFIGVTFFLFLIVAGLAIYQLVRTGEFRRFLIDEIEKQTELKVHLGEADLEIGWVTGIAFGNVGLSEPGAVKPGITAERITARVALTPLIQRQVVVYEIRIQKPAVRFTREKDGRIPLLDRLLNLPFLKQQDEQFSLDLRTVRVQNGVIDYADRRVEGGVGEWRLVNANVALQRVRGQRLRSFMKDWLKRPSSEPAGTGLEFDLRGALVKNNATMNLKSAGRLLFPKDVFELEGAHWIADIELVNFPATLVKEYVGARVPIRSMAGQLAQRVHVEGNPGRQLKVKGDLEFKQLALDAPEVFLAPLNRVDGRTSFEFDWDRQRLQIVRAEYRANDVRFSLQGEVSALDRDDPHVRLNFSALSAPLTALRRYLPFKLIESPRLERVVNSIHAGQLEVTRAGVESSLSDLQRLTGSDGGRRFWVEADLREGAGNLGIDGTLPLRGVQGRLSLNNGVLQVQNLKAVYGDSTLTRVDGSYDLNPEANGKADVQASADVNLAELRAQLRSGLFSKEAAKLATSVQDLAGRGKVDLALKISANAPADFSAKVALDEARARYDGYSLSDLNGDILLTPKEIHGENLRAQLSGSPVQLRLALKDYTAEDGAFDVTVDSPGVKAGLITSLLLDGGRLQDPGFVRGTVRYSGSFNAKVRRRFTGNLELINVQVMVHPLLQPLRDLNGRIGIDEKGVDLQNLRAILAGFPASASGRWRFAEKPQLFFDFAAPNLDVTYLISQIDPEVSEFYKNLQAEGKITLTKGRIKNFEFSDLKTDASIDHRVWRLTNLTARSAEGRIAGVTTINDQTDTLGIVAEPRVQAVPVQAFFKWFDITNTEMTGRVNLTGKLETVGKNDAERKQNLNGAFQLRIEEGTINRMRTVVQILNLLDLSRWFTLQLPDLTKQGIRFRAITGDFKVNQGVYSTENLLVDSNDLRMTGAGKIDVPKDEIDFIVAVRPFAGIDSAITQIPILGRGIAAIKNTFLVASFNINGKIDDPTITPAPLGTLTEWFWNVLGLPKSITGLGEGEKKDPPKEAAKPPAK